VEIVYACWRLNGAADEYAASLREGDEAEAKVSLKRLRKIVAELSNEVKHDRMDGAFFAGELDAKAGENKVLYPGDPDTKR